MKKVVVTMLLCLLPCLADADDFQCKNGIVSEGATRDEVLSKETPARWGINRISIPVYHPDGHA